MTSVKSIVESETERMLMMKDKNEKILKEREERMRLIKFDKEVDSFISDFENRLFKLESSNGTVASAILRFKENNRTYVTGDQYEVLNFSSRHDKNRIPPDKSVVFFKWLLKLERKFDIRIEFYEYKTEQRRYGTMSGYEHQSDYRYEGICVKFFTN